MIRLYFPAVKENVYRFFLKFFSDKLCRKFLLEYLFYLQKYTECFFWVNMISKCKRKKNYVFFFNFCSVCDFDLMHYVMPYFSDINQYTVAAYRPLLSCLYGTRSWTIISRKSVCIWENCKTVDSKFCYVPQKAQDFGQTPVPFTRKWSEPEFVTRFELGKIKIV